MTRNVLYAALAASLVFHRHGWGRGLLAFVLSFALFSFMDFLKDTIQASAARRCSHRRAIEVNR